MEVLKEPVAPELSRRQLLAILLGAVVVATAILVLFVMPVQYHMDLTGFGRLTGLDRLAGRPGVSVSKAKWGDTHAKFQLAPYRNDSIDIPLAPAAKSKAGEADFAVRLKAGDVMVYSWSVSGLPGPDTFRADFNSESDPSPAVQVLSYRQRFSDHQSGSLVAPFTGRHGWYFQNQSGRPVVVRLRLAGYYDLGAQAPTEAPR